MILTKNKMKKFHLLLLSLLSALILSAGWPARGFPLLLLAGFVPLLFVEDYFYQNKKDFSRFAIIFYSFIAFALWNLLTTWWIYNSTFIGALLAVVLNSFFMSVVFTLFHITRRNIRQTPLAYLSLIFYWIAFEFIHLDWDLSWPWLQLGNGFANYPQWIQWYEYTGIFGGSLWILSVNILIFACIKRYLADKTISRSWLWMCLGTLTLIILPVFLSLVRYYTYTEKTNPVDVVVIQPNVDPYTEEYELEPSVICQRIIDLASQKVDQKTDFVVCPESALQEYAWENMMNRCQSFDRLRMFMKNYPKLKMVVGISSRRAYQQGDTIPHTARKFSDADMYYDSYNTAVLLDTSANIQKHHKSKLTPGVEEMPFADYMKFIEKYAIDLGGTVGSLGTDAVHYPFAAGNNLKIGTAICYESAYGEYLGDFIRKGANLLFVITNDGWWGNTAGHRQHLTFSSLRAIESRRSIARSANTGTSAFVNQRGDVFQATEYWKRAVIRQRLNANDEITFYTRYGDYIGRICFYGSPVLLLLVVAFWLKRKKRI